MAGYFEEKKSQRRSTVNDSLGNKNWPTKILSLKLVSAAKIMT